MHIQCKECGGKRAAFLEIHPFVSYSVKIWFRCKDCGTEFSRVFEFSEIPRLIPDCVSNISRYLDIKRCQEALCEKFPEEDADVEIND